ncbi:O-antigen ligase [Flavobacteriaceae bacterium MAR_2010_72]|nr:O-antigen ligase [Flavobacteriaceae bacterium MAR_2010_72]TVZ58263.1 O-antigen ligase [Flavobacteriaceae bacterium MAR_2010_105]
MSLKEKLNNLYVYLLFGLAFLIPSGIYKLEGVIIALLLIIWIATKQFKEIFQQSILLPLFFLLYLVSLAYTENFSKGLTQIMMHLSYLFVPLILSSKLIDEEKRKKILLIFLSSTVLFIFIADLFALWDILKTGSYITRIGTADYYKFLSYGLTRVFSDWHPTLVSLFLIISFVITVKYILKSKKVFAIPLIAFIILNVFLLKSLIGILCLFFVICIFFFSLIKKKSYKFILVSIMIVLGSVFYFTNPFNIDKIEKFKKTKIEITDDEERRNVLSIRLVKWSSALNLIKGNPLLGVAPGDLKQDLDEVYKKNGFDYVAANRFGPHNQFLQILASFGFIGLILFLTITFLPYYNQIEFKSLYSWFLLITLMFFLTEDVLERQQGIVFFSFFYSLFVLKTKNS